MRERKKISFGFQFSVSQFKDLKFPPR